MDRSGDHWRGVRGLVDYQQVVGGVMSDITRDSEGKCGQARDEVLHQILEAPESFLGK